MDNNFAVTNHGPGLALVWIEVECRFPLSLLPNGPSVVTVKLMIPEGGALRAAVPVRG